MNTSVNTMMASVRTIRYTTLPRRRFSAALEISVRVVAPAAGRRRSGPAIAGSDAIPGLLTALSGEPQEPAGEDGEDQHEHHAQGRRAVVVAGAAQRERVLVDEHHHRQR